jgi:phospholipase C
MKLKVSTTSKGNAQQSKQTKGLLETKGESQRRYPKYVSPATQGITITEYAPGSPEPSTPTIAVDVAPNAPGCIVSYNPATQTCTFSFQAPVGLDNFAVAAYDQPPNSNGQIPSTAHLLSAGVAGNVDIMQGVVNTVAITLGGQVASLVFAPSTILAVADNQQQSYPFYVEPLDADGYIIIPAVGQSPYNNGQGQNISVAVTSGDPLNSVTIVPPGASAPDPTLFTASYTGAAIQDAVLTASLPGGPSSTGNFTPLTYSPANLSLTYAPKPHQNTGTVSAQTALSTTAVYASIANNAVQCSVSPASATPASPGASVSFTVTAVNSGTCTVNLTETSSAQSVTAGVPVTINGTSYGLGLGGGKIQHIVLIIQENRSFDNIFGGLDNNGKPLPGADTASNPTDGQLVPHDHLGNVVKLQSLPLGVPSCYNPGHEHVNQFEDIDGGAMDGFDITPPVPIAPCVSPTAPGPAPTDWVYQTIAYYDVAPYWQMAEQYAIADHHFEQISSASFSEHLVLMSATNGGTITNPTQNAGNAGWGCDDAFLSTTYSNLFDPTQPGTQGVQGVNPCFNWPTFADELTSHSLPWRYYAAQYATKPDFGYQWSSLDAFQQDRYGPIWTNNVTGNLSTNIINDVAGPNGFLGAFTYVTPLLATSDHPRSGTNNGPPYVTAIVNAIGASKFWPSTAIILLWDDFGGMYDHIPPPYWPQGTTQYPNPHPGPAGPGPSYAGPDYGLRTGLIVISPWVKHKFVFKQYTSSAMILKFAEEVLNLPSLGGYDTDPNMADLSGMFDFTQSPNFNFTPISATQSVEKIKKLGKKPSGPPDDY